VADFLARAFIVLFFLLYVAVAMVIVLALVKQGLGPAFRKLFRARPRREPVRSTRQSDARS
jgi:hypothetical protein